MLHASVWAWRLCANFFRFRKSGEVVFQIDLTERAYLTHLSAEHCVVQLAQHAVACTMVGRLCAEPAVEIGFFVNFFFVARRWSRTETWFLRTALLLVNSERCVRRADLNFKGQLTGQRKPEIRSGRLGDVRLHEVTHLSERLTNRSRHQQINPETSRVCRMN